MLHFKFIPHQFRPISFLTQELESWGLLKRLSFSKGDFWRIGIAFSFLLLETLAIVGTPWAFSRLVAHLSQKIPLNSGESSQKFYIILVSLLILYGIISLLKGILSGARDILVLPLKTFLKKQLALLGLEHLLSLESDFHVNRQIGALTRIIDRGSESIGTMLELIISNIIPNFVSLILTFIIISHIFNYKYIILLFFVIFIYSLVSLYFTKARMQARREKNRLNNEAHHQLVDIITNIETVKLFANERYELEKYQKIRELYRKSEIKLQYFVSSSQIVRNSIIAITTSFFLSLAGFDIINHHLSVANFVLLGGYLRNIYASVAALNYVSAGWRNAHVDIENFLELLNRPTAKISAVTSSKKEFISEEERGKMDICFENVSFSYMENMPILQEIDFHLPAGSVLGIVGVTGSGKSTLLKLLHQDYVPSEGRILMNGHDIEVFEPELLKSLIGVVPQETSLFNATIGENIAYGKLSASLEEIKRAARLAKLEDFIDSLPEKYETQVGERGLKLSGGERQRIALARIFLREPALLLFDEASSALDTKTESLIQEELKSLFKTRTTIIVAHRLSTIKEADYIFIMDKGRIIERGNHESLYHKKGLYREMWDAQKNSSLDNFE